MTSQYSTVEMMEIGKRAWKTASRAAKHMSKHSKIVNPNFTNTTDFLPTARLDYGKNLGSDWEAGLSTEARWMVGSSPSIINQNGKWQVGARLHAIPTGIELSRSKATIKVYPNPVAEYLTIEGNEPLDKVSIYNSYWREIYQIQPGMNNSITLKLDFLYAGIYFIRVQSKASEEMRKIIVR